MGSAPDAQAVEAVTMSRALETTDGYRIRSKAEMSQTDVWPWESKLLALARLSHPTVSWWWGMRKVGNNFGAFCYLHDAMIVTWNRRWPMTTKAKVEVGRHRALHREHAGVVVDPRRST
jgi:hypothetical protein